MSPTLITILTTYVLPVVVTAVYHYVINPAVTGGSKPPTIAPATPSTPASNPAMPAVPTVTPDALHALLDTLVNYLAANPQVPTPSQSKRPLLHLLLDGLGGWLGSQPMPTPVEAPKK